MIDDGLSEHTRLVEFELTEKATVPVKPLTGERLIVEEPETPALTATDVGLDVIVKSWMMYVALVECDRLPLVPVTVTWKVEVDRNVHESVALPEPVTLEGVMAHDVLLVVRLTGPEKPF